MTKEDFPRLLKKWRVANGLTQKAFAARLGIHQSTYSGYETGYAIPSYEVRGKLMRETCLDTSVIPCGQHYINHENCPLTPEEQRFAAEHCKLADQFISIHHLQYDEWYGIIVMGYLNAVQLWFVRKDLHKYSFVTIATKCMRSSMTHEYEKQRHRPRTVSLDDIIPGTEDLTYGETLCDPRDCVRT